MVSDLNVFMSVGIVAKGSWLIVHNQAAESIRRSELSFIMWVFYSVIVIEIRFWVRYLRSFRNFWTEFFSLNIKFFLTII